MRKTQRYPTRKLALSALCPFHGPQVESEFSIMPNILQAKAANLPKCGDIQSYRVVKYNLKAMQVSAIHHYSGKTKESTINVRLCRNVKLSSQRYRALLREKELNKRPYHSVNPMAGKKMAKDAIVAAAVSARRKFQKWCVQALRILLRRLKPKRHTKIEAFF